MTEHIHDIPPAVMGLAHQLLAHEVGEADQQLEPESVGIAIEHVYATFQRRLSELIGQAGFVALFGRALHLARRESPILAGMAIEAQPPHTLLGTRELAAVHASAAMVAYAAIVAHFIWLLVTFLGEQLSMHLIADLWPQVVHDTIAHGGPAS